MAQKRLLDRIKDSLAQEGLVSRTEAARKWLREKVKDLSLNSSAKMGFVNASGKSKQPNRSGLQIGKMYFYFYDPKTKDDMPYYDRFPLVIPIDYMPKEMSATKRDAGFLGLNLHYIHPKHRIILLDKLSEINNNSLYDDTTKMRISYDYIKRSSNTFEASACLKWYLFKQVRSKVLEVSADEWDICALLPFEAFEKATKHKVWADSRKRF